MHEYGEEVGIVFHQELDDSSNEDGHVNVGIRSKDLTPTQSRKPKKCDKKRLKLAYHKFKQISLHRRSIIKSLAQALDSKRSTLQFA